MAPGERRREIEIHVRLHGMLREKLPPDARGRTTLRLPDNTTIADVIRRLNIPQPVSFAVNEEVELGETTRLKDGDHVEIFRLSAGG